MHVKVFYTLHNNTDQGKQGQHWNIESVPQSQEHEQRVAAHCHHCGTAKAYTQSETSDYTPHTPMQTRFFFFSSEYGKNTKERMQSLDKFVAEVLVSYKGIPEFLAGQGWQGSPKP